MTDKAQYHFHRRERERRLAAAAHDERAKRAHANLARLHDLQLLLQYLPGVGPTVTVD